MTRKLSSDEGKVYTDITSQHVSQCEHVMRSFIMVLFTFHTAGTELLPARLGVFWSDSDVEDDPPSVPARTSSGALM